MRKLLVLLVAIAMMFTVVGTASAATSSTYMYVYAYVGGSCTVGASNLSFSTTTGSSTFADAYVYTYCSYGQSYKITMDKGYAFDGSYRRVADGYGNYIRYIIYKPGTSYTEWGDSDFANTYSWGSSVSGTGVGTYDYKYFSAYLYAPTVNGTFWDYVYVTVNY